MYFGRLKVSALRIRYETMQLRAHYEQHLIGPGDTEHLLLLNQDAYADWARRYPADGWLASTGFAMAQLFAELPGSTARTHAVELYAFVKSHFPKAPQAHSAAQALHNGVPVRPQPSWTVKPSPSPSPAAAAPAASSPAASSPAPSQSAASPTPAPSASP